MEVRTGFVICDKNKEAYDWVNAQSSKGVVPLSLMVWSELLQCYRVVEKYY